MTDLTTIQGARGPLSIRFQTQEYSDSPIVVIFHNPDVLGGSIDDLLITSVANLFHLHGFATMRFNFSGSQNSRLIYDDQHSELMDATSVCTWIYDMQKSSQAFWVVGISYGCSVAMQLVMRRLEISHFILISPLVKHFDYSIINPCPRSGAVFFGTEDKVSPPSKIEENIVLKIKEQLLKGYVIKLIPIEGANHFFNNKVDDLITELDLYIQSNANFGDAFMLENQTSRNYQDDNLQDNELDEEYFEEVLEEENLKEENPENEDPENNEK